MKIRKIIGFAIILLLTFSSTLAEKKPKKVDFAFDLIRAFYFTETYVDLAMTSILAERGYEDMNPLYNWHMKKPALSLALTQLSNLAVYYLSENLFHQCEKRKKKYFAYAVIIGLFLIKSYAIWHNSQAFR